MKKTKFTEEQIVFALQQHKAGGNSDRRNLQTGGLGADYNKKTIV